MRTTLVAGSALLLLSCGVDQPLRPPPAIADPAQATEVTVIRPKGFIASEYAIYVTYAGQALTELGEAQFTRFRVPAGRQAIGVACVSDRNAIDADFRAGEAAYFVIRPSANCASVEQVDARTAAALMASARSRALPQLRAGAPPSPPPAAPRTAASAPASPCPPFAFTLDGGRSLDAAVLRRDRPELYETLERPAVRDLFLAEWRPTLARLGVTNAVQAYAACGGIVDDVAGRLSVALSRGEAEELARALNGPAMDKFLAELLRMRGEPRLAPEIAARLARPR